MLASNRVLRRTETLGRGQQNEHTMRLVAVPMNAMSQTLLDGHGATLDGADDNASAAGDSCITINSDDDNDDNGNDTASRGSRDTDQDACSDDTSPRGARAQQQPGESVVRPTVGDCVSVISGEYAGRQGEIAQDDQDHKPYRINFIGSRPQGVSRGQLSDYIEESNVTRIPASAALRLRLGAVAALSDNEKVEAAASLLADALSAAEAAAKR